MSKRILVILLVGIICACTSNTIMKKPNDLIPKDQMIDLLTDMYTAVSAENVKNINEKRNINYFQLIWDKYHIDSTRFNRSSFYYSSKIDEYDKILEQVEKNIKSINKTYQAEIQIADSLVKVKKDSLRQVKKDSLKIRKDSLKIRKDSILETIKNRTKRKSERTPKIPRTVN